MPPPSTQLEQAGQNTGVVLIPVKAFNQAKGRLSDAVGASTRERLAREMAANLITVQRNVTVAVCCDDEEVASWAGTLGASTIWCPGTDLNGAVQHGLDEVRAAGYASVAVAHSDLPMATSLDVLLGWTGVTLVPDRHRTGSNVICLPADLDFRFSYGSSSFQRHTAEAVRHRRGLRIVHDAALGWDVDQPDDLAMPTHSFVNEILESETPA